MILVLFNLPIKLIIWTMEKWWSRPPLIDLFALFYRGSSLRFLPLVKKLKASYYSGEYPSLGLKFLSLKEMQDE